MKIGKKPIKIVNIPAQKEKFREAFRHKFKGFLSKNPLMWLGDVATGAAFMLWHFPTAGILKCLAIGTSMTIGGALGGIPLAFAGGLAGGYLAKRFVRTPRAIRNGAIIGSFTLGIAGIVGGNIVGYRIAKKHLIKPDPTHAFNEKAAPQADKKTLVLTPAAFNAYRP